MSNGQDINSKPQSEPGESLKDVAQTKISSTDKDALGDSALDSVAGGTGGGSSTPIGPRAVGG
jgi:hypothetical protein